jgi:hypothetical protein
MAEETNIPPMEAQQPEEPQMMKFSDLEAMTDKGTQLEEGQTPPPAQPEQAPEDPVAKVLAETGFKSIDELVKSQKEGHATITKLSQERAALQRDMDAMANFPQMLQSQMRKQPPSQPTQPQGQPDSLTAELFKDMAPFMDQLIEQRLMEKAPLIVDQKLSMRDLGIKVNAKRSENPEEFDELRPIMQNILRERPQYEAHPDGLNVVFEMARQVRDSRIANLTSKLLGDDIPLDKFREAVKLVMSGQQTAPVQTPQQAPPVNPSSYVPPSNANTPPMAQRQTNYDTEIASRMKGKIDSQTVDDVTDLWWQKVTSTSQADNINRPRR